jgi:lambda family phage portal protein
MGFFSRLFGGEDEQPQPQNSSMSRRQQRQLAASISGMFNSAKQDRLNESWGVIPLTADLIIYRNQMQLVARSREQVNNNDYAKKFVRMCVQNIVGPEGVLLQGRVKKGDETLDDAANQAIEHAWKEWGEQENCDITGQMDWWEIEKACVISMAKDGEFMLRKIFGRPAGKWGFALQVLDPQRCPVDYNRDYLENGEFIRSGIHFNKWGKPLFYYFQTVDGNTPDANEMYYSWGGRKFLQVAADEIIHGYEREMVGQKRGLPWMATALFRLRQLNGFEDAAIVNARVAAAKMGVLQWRENETPVDYDPDDEMGVQMDAEPGTFQELPPGLELKGWEPQWAAGEYMPVHKSVLRGVAAGMGVAYNNLANDLEGVNFSSIRSGTLDEREQWMDRQKLLIKSLCRPVFKEWLPRALLAGLIKNTKTSQPLPASKLAAYKKHHWQPRRWSWVDPKADVAAAVESKNNLLSSPGQLIRESGRDPHEVWREFSRDIKAMRDAGIPDEFIMAAILPENWVIKPEVDGSAVGAEDPPQPAAAK